MGVASCRDGLIRIKLDTSSIVSHLWSWGNGALGYSLLGSFQMSLRDVQKAQMRSLLSCEFCFVEIHYHPSMEDMLCIVYMADAADVPFHYIYF